MKQKTTLRFAKGNEEGDRIPIRDIEEQLEQHFRKNGHEFKEVRITGAELGDRVAYIELKMSSGATVVLPLHTPTDIRIR